MTSPPQTASKTPRRARRSARRTRLRQQLLPPVVILLLLLLIHWPHKGLFQHAGQASYSAALSILAATLALVGLFQLAARTANERVAWATVVTTALYAVFYEATTSARARPDVLATAFVMWGLLFVYLRARGSMWRRLLAPLAVALAAALFRLVSSWQAANGAGDASTAFGGFAAREWRSVVEACGVRAWQAFGDERLYLLTAAMVLLTAFVKPVSERGGVRGRIDVKEQLGFAVVALVYIILLSFAPDARRASEMLPVVALVVLVSVSTVYRRVRYWLVVVAAVCAAFSLL